MQQPSTTLLIDHPGLYHRTITVTAQSTVELADDRAECSPYDFTAQPKAGLRVDGRFISLVLCKFLIGRPELAERIEAVKAEVEAAIAALGEAQAAPEPRSPIIVQRGPHAGQPGELLSGPDAGGYYDVAVAGQSERWLLLPGEFRAL